MASITKEITIETSADAAWEVISDFAAGPTRMAPGFVTDTHHEADHRHVTFADGTTARERLISLDHDARRIVYSVVGGTAQPEHDNAAMHIIADGPHRCRLRWSRDVLPDTLAEPMAAVMDQGLVVIKRTLTHQGDPHPGPPR